jgi:VCBS repeat-containing protein
LNYAGEFSARLHEDDSLGSHSGAHLHVDAVSAHAVPLDAIIVPDANLLFHGEFKRSGVDLILSKDDHQLVLQDYFKGEKRAALSSPDGAHLTGDLINALAGHVQYSQADGNVSAGQVIGHVTKLVGAATAVRNGVSIVLNQGDNVEKGDVVQSGSDSTLGITFIDGTVFGLSSNARMVLNEMVYDPNGSSNSSLLSLVAGTISFVAGETAKHGDMKIDTPVATMGIRGTAVLVEIDFDIPTAAQTPGPTPSPSAKFQVLVEPDGSTGSYILFDKTTLAPIATVNQAGTATVISNGSVNFLTSAPLSTDLQKLINDVFTLKFTDNTNPNTKLADHHTDAPIPVTSSLITLADGASALPKFLLVNSSDKSSASGSGGTPKSLDHIDGPPTIAVVDTKGDPATSFSVLERGGTTGDIADHDAVSGNVNFVDINVGDRPTVTAKFNSFTYQNAANKDVSATLTPQQLADIAAVEAKLAVVQNPANNNNGSANWTYTVPDSAFDFLAAGETLTLKYIAQVDNNFAPNDEFSTQSFTITVTGANDVPVITTSAPALAFTGDHQADGFLSATDPTTGKPAPTGGTLSFNDPDLTDTHSVSVKLVVPPGSNIPPGPLQAFEAALTATIGADSTGTGNGTINWQLAPLPDFLADFVPQDQSITLTYTIEVTDSQGATSTQDVTIVLGHAAPPDVAWIHPTGGFWNTASNWETGTVPTAGDDVVIPDEQVLGGTGHYAVTINSAAFAKSVTLNAENTDGAQLINTSTLEIGGALTLFADGVLNNFGTVKVGGKFELLDQSILANTGLLILENGGDFEEGSTVRNFNLQPNGANIDLVGGTLNDETAILNGGLITVEQGASLTLLDLANVTGGQLHNRGTLDLQDTSFLQNGSLGNSGQFNVSGTANALDGESVTNSGAGAIEITGVLTLDLGASIHGGTLTNSGTLKIESPSGATLDGVVVGGLGLVQADAGSELHLKDTTVNGGVVTTAANGLLDAESGSSFIKGAVVNIAGIVEVTGGTLTIDAASTVNDTGLLEANGGNLIVDPTFTGSAEIVGASLLELGANSPTAYSSANIAFASGSSGTLQLDHSKVFSGTVSGLDDNTLDLRDITSGTNTTVTFSGDSNGGILTIVSNTDPTQVAHINLTGDYLGSHWTATADAAGVGTAITEAPGAIAGLDSQGHAVDGMAVTALITDGGQPVTGATYQWQLDGQDILNATNATYLPTDANEGHLLTVKVSFTDALNHVDTSSVSAGTVVAAPPVIDTDHFTVTPNADGSIAISGLGVTDSDPAAASEIFTVNASTSAPGTSLSAHTDTGSLARINADLQNGGSYNPGPTPPPTDKVTLTVAGSFGESDTVNFIFKATATDPNSPLLGTPGKDVIFASSHQDALTGGGGQDQFVFNPSFGAIAAQHTVTDFMPGLDKIDLRLFGNFNSFSDVQLAETQLGNDTLITLDDHHDTLLLKNVAHASLSANDFILHGG